MSRDHAPSNAVGDQNGVIAGPEADMKMLQLASPAIRRREFIAHLADATRSQVQRRLGMPLGNVLLRRWLHGKPGARLIERAGLPRHSVELLLGAQPLTLNIDPRSLIRNVEFLPRKVEKRPSSMAFIWDGDWDLRRDDLRLGTRYSFISEIDENRHQLELTTRYQELMACIERGQPWSSHHQGIVLDTPEKIKEYCNVYIRYLDRMATAGYLASITRDELGVAISREGRILKINRGLHRLAMAQRVGLPTIPLRVRAVHRTWWDEVTGGKSGLAALEGVCEALRTCVAEQNPGSLDRNPTTFSSEGFWPPVRVASDCKQSGSAEERPAGP